MKHYILLTLLLMILASCTSSTDGGDAIETLTRIVYLDENGNNLLNPNHENAITETNTSVYYLKDGEKVKRNNKFYIAEESGEYVMGVHPNLGSSQETAITYIEPGDFDVDTIKVAYMESNSTIAVTKVWCNSELKWDVDSREDREIQVVKVGSGD